MVRRLSKRKGSLILETDKLEEVAKMCDAEHRKHNMRAMNSSGIAMRVETMFARFFGWLGDVARNKEGD